MHSQLFTQKALLQRIMENLKIKYSDVNTPVPVEIQGLLQKVQQSMQQVEVKVKLYITAVTFSQVILSEGLNFAGL